MPKTIDIINFRHFCSIGHFNLNPKLKTMYIHVKNVVRLYNFVKVDWQRNRTV